MRGGSGAVWRICGVSQCRVNRSGSLPVFFLFHHDWNPLPRVPLSALLGSSFANVAFPSLSSKHVSPHRGRRVR